MSNKWILLYLSWLFKMYAASKHGTEFAEIIVNQVKNRLAKGKSIDEEFANIDEAFVSWLKILDKGTSNAITKDLTKIDGVEVPLEVFAALLFLELDPYSPYYKKQGETNCIEFDLGAAFVDAKNRTIDFIRNAIEIGGPSDYSTEWEWSKKPGAFERQLQRRHNNPLFPAAAREITSREVYESRNRDELDLMAFAKEAHAIFKSWPEEYPGLSILNKIRERIDELTQRAPEIGGNAYDILNALQEMREPTIDVWRTAQSDNQEALDALEKAESITHSPEFDILNNEFFCQLSRKNGPITPEEAIPSLLTESPVTIRLFLRALKEKGKDVQEIIDLGKKILSECIVRGDHIDQAEEKLKALGIDDKKSVIDEIRAKAEQGDATAQCNLGIRYDNGRGVHQNYVEAYAYFKVAASLNDQLAKESLSILQKCMTPAHVAEGQRQAESQWEKIKK